MCSSLFLCQTRYIARKPILTSTLEVTLFFDGVLLLEICGDAKGCRANCIGSNVRLFKLCLIVDIFSTHGTWKH